MEQYKIFTILDSVDSTNNYAMGMVHEGLATHGMACFANTQTAGKGQRGKTWLSEPGNNIILSITMKPVLEMKPRHFFLHALISLSCIQFLHRLTGENFKIKWPNDIYWCDRKAGGILIENVVQGNQWKWTVCGIGININQTIFPPASGHPVSVKTITGLTYDPVVLAMELHQIIMQEFDRLPHTDTTELMQSYNDNLYRKGAAVRLRKGNIVFSTTIAGVDKEGVLHTRDVIDRYFHFGEVEFI